MLPRHRFVIHWPQLRCIWYSSKRASLFRSRIHFLCRQHDWHWLLSECRKRSAGNNYHSSPGSRIYVDRILCAPSGIGYTGYLASRTIGRVINHFLYFRNLFERSFHCLPTISIFAIWEHSLKNFAIDTRYLKPMYSLYWTVWKRSFQKERFNSTRGDKEL